MELFVDQIDDNEFQSKLDFVLQRKSPFQNFKNAVDNSDYRQKWFDFKQSELEKIVETELKRR